MTFGGITKVFLKKMEFNIKKIEYISPSKANLTMVVRGPIILNSNFNLDEKDKKEISKLFKERTGKSTEYLSKVSEKELLEKWMPKLTDIISERVLEKVNNLKKFNEKEGNVRAEKINGKWNFFTEEELKNEKNN